MWLDLLALCVLGAFVVLGLLRGGFATGMGLLALGVGYAAALFGSALLAPFVARALALPELVALPLAGSGSSSPASPGSRCSASGCGARGFGDGERSARDRFLGAVFGGVRGALVVLLIAYLALWLDAIRVTGGNAPLPPVAESTTARVTSDLVEAGVEAALEDSGTAGRMAARVAARPAHALEEWQAVLETPSVQGLREDTLFWSHVEHENVDAALNRGAALRLMNDAPLRARLAELGVVSEASTGAVTAHPVAPVPDRLFDDEREQRWRARFTAPRMSRPAGPATPRTAASTRPTPAAPPRSTPGTGPPTCTARSPTGAAARTSATLPPGRRDGLVVRRHRRRRVRALGRRAVRRPPGRRRRRARRCPASRTATRPGWRSAARSSPSAPPPTTAPGSGCAAATARPRCVYAHAEDAGRRRAVRGRDAAGDQPLRARRLPPPGGAGACRVADGSAVAEKSDGPGKGLTPLAFAPVAGDPRLLLLHERRGREELLIWDVVADTETELAHRPARRAGRRLLPRTAARLLVWHTHAARTRLHRYDLATGELTELPVAAGLRRLGARSARTARSSTPARRPREPPTGPRAAPGRHRPRAGHPARRARAGLGAGRGPVGGRAGRAGARAGRPARPDATGPPPTVFSLHGGPHAADEDRFSAVRAAWVDAGFAVVEVNYRGSTGLRLGLARRDRGPARAAPSWRTSPPCVDRVRRRRASSIRSGCVVEGWSWGGYLALLAVGHAAGALGRRRSPGCRWPTTSPPTPTRWSSCARSTGRCSAARRRSGPEAYRAASPLTYVDARARAGARAGRGERPALPDPADRQLPRRAGRPRGRRYEVSRFDAGHGCAGGGGDDRGTSPPRSRSPAGAAPCAHGRRKRRHRW